VVGLLPPPACQPGKWTDREIRSKTEAGIALDELRAAVRARTFDERGLRPRPESSSLTFRQFAEIYTEKHARAKSLALATEINYRLKPLLERFGDRAPEWDPNRGHRGLRRGSQEAAPRERPAGAASGAGVHQPLAPTAAPHVQLGGRP